MTRQQAVLLCIALFLVGAFLATKSVVAAIVLIVAGLAVSFWSRTLPKGAGG